jgi:CheY-like chemotaxis protein
MPRAKILVIEDNSSDVFLLRRALIAAQGDDLELEIAADGERALQLIRSRVSHHEEQPCVILLDLHLPKHDGFEVLTAIRQNPVLAEVHVMVTTNLASPKEADELRRMGVEYRLKPRDLAEFVKLAADLIEICHCREVPA